MVTSDAQVALSTADSLSSNSLLAVSKTPGSNYLNYRNDIKVHTSKRMG